MITLSGLAVALAWGGVLVTFGLVAVCWRNPAAGLAHLNHQLENLPSVMLGRYIGFFIMAVGFALLQNLAAIFIFATGLSFMAFHDATTYSKAGKPIARHLMAGIAGAIVTVIAGLAWITNGATV